ncbi:MAG: YybH family protein [Solirubrobacterales bacterium]
METVRAFVEALDRGDLGAAIACFATNSCFVTPDSTAVSGRGAIRSVLAQLIAQRTTIAIESSSTLVAGDVVFVNQRWRIRLGASPDGTYSQAVSPILVLCLERGDWRLSIAAPWSRSD